MQGHSEMAVVDQSVDQINRKLDSLKIDVHRKVCETLEVHKDVSTRLEQQVHASPISESLNSSSGSISSYEATGDAASSYSSRDEYPELTYVAAPDGFITPHGTMYAGSAAPLVNMNAYMPYPIEDIHYHAPVMEYNFVNQPFCGSLPSGMQYSVGNNGYPYGPQVFQYPPPSYYHQAPGGQYLHASPCLPAGGMMMLDSQDPARPGVVMSNGFSNMNAFAGPMPGFPVPMLPLPAPCEKGDFPVSVTYPPSHTLRASAPAWIEPSAKPKGFQMEGNGGGVHPGAPQSTVPANTVLPNKAGSLNPQGSAVKNSPALSKATATAYSNLLGTPDSVATQDVKANGCLEDDSKQEGRVGGSMNGQNVSLNAHYEQNKDAWVSKVRGQQLVPITKNFKALCGNLNKESGTCLPNGDHYNLADFTTKYDDAKHFIIKSYSDENVRRSIQYGVWASTPNGNKKLDEAFQDAQRRAGGKPRGCPVFLFFSVNGSRQFCGVAEMTGPVDHCRTMEFWEQHKWNGSFPVKWHIIKDLPNSQLRRIILENNENKPVTNSRDTQEVSFQHGLEMLNIFKNFPARTSILDDFPFYPSPQKVLQDMKPVLWSQCFPKIGEESVKEQNEVDGLRIAKLNTITSNTCVTGFQPKEAVCQERPDKAVLATKTSEALVKDSLEDEEKKELEKENIKIPNKVQGPV